ncbi:MULTISPECIES: AIPR family protein [Streptomyces]|uniref:AIPR family protein n=1 Tax=Streptomyces TaxID=1883 RepID=UPI00167595F7|nr:MULTISPECIES: AIPR family protein [Streptomyces]WGP12887.1 AIPR family protein [Streptomyces sp. SH5]GGP79232.1 putative abortive infection phage resistance protein [Streptomyces sindenensis]
MRALRVRHIQDSLSRDFENLIDLSDYEGRPAEQRQSAFFSRALAARAVQRYTGATPVEAAKSVVDGFGDNGIDAIAIDEENRRIVLVQSKLDNSGNAGLSQADALKIRNGCGDLFNMRFHRFSETLRERQEAISAALSDAAVTFIVVVATTGRSTLPNEAQIVFDDFLEEVNENDPVVSLEVLGLKEFHSMVVEGTAGPSIDITVPIEQWGTVDLPFQAYYGLVQASEIASWYEHHGDRLFSQNLRKSLGNTDVNEGLTATLLNQGQHFWYFNNGITALCQSVKKTPRGGATHAYGDFVVDGVSVVNGAQTVASIHRAAKKSEAALADARVWVRFISLEGCPPDFAIDVTRATNTQNSVENRDFVALDPQQERLRRDMLLSLHKQYSVKRGESAPAEADGCTVEDAIVALACALDNPYYTVMSKSSVGRLSENTERAPYVNLFNGGTTAHRVWRCVQVMRAVESDLQERRPFLYDREFAIATHGNRIILQLVFSQLNLSKVSDPQYNWDGELARIHSVTGKVLDALIAAIEDSYPSNYLAPLFKNTTKCRDLVGQVQQKLSAS